jgi:hypothetical protein
MKMKTKRSRNTTKQLHHIPFLPKLVLVVIGFLWIDTTNETKINMLPGLQVISAEEIKSSQNCAEGSPETTCTTTIPETNNNNEQQQQQQQHDDDEPFVCGVYLAPSTLPGTGLGMYAGPKGFQIGEMITKTLGDHVVAIPDQKTAHSDTGLYDRDSDDMTKYFLWDQYTWNADTFGINVHHLSMQDIEIASPGFGAAANSFMDFVNVEEGGVDFGLLPPNDPSEPNYQVHRSKDPGAGAFTPFHTRKAWATEYIAPNSEFFVSYGNEWFLDRAWRLGTIPVKGDHFEAEYLWRKFSKEFLGRNVSLPEDFEEDENDDNEELPVQLPPIVDDELKAVYREFWDTIVASFTKTTWNDSRIFTALPNEPSSEDYETMLTTEGGYKAVKQQKMKRSQDWLDTHGICADAVRIGRSTLPSQQVGHGAFTNTNFKEGQVVMGAPLIHIPDKNILSTFYKGGKKMDDDDEDDDEEDDDEFEDFDDFNHRVLTKYAPAIGYAKTGEQLLVNYVFGHRDSTMLLSPYGPGVQLINHNQTLVNVKIQWAEPHRSNHHPELLEKPVKYINDEFPLGSVLGFEIVATKDIAPDEELYLDYGDEWEEAWQHHLQVWIPTKGSKGYISAIDLNTLPEHSNKPLPNWFGKKNNNNNNEQPSSPFPKNVRLMMSTAWSDDTVRKEKGDDFITEQLMWDDYDYHPVEVVFKTGTVSNKYKYLVEDEELLEQLTPEQQEDVKIKYAAAAAAANNASSSGAATDDSHSTTTTAKDDDDDSDNSLYTVVVKNPIQYDEEERQEARKERRDLPSYEHLTIKNVPRRGLKFEDLSYTTDQFLENAFREYIRIPDEIFPEAWKNIKSAQEKQDHYWKYRIHPGEDEPRWNVEEKDDDDDDYDEEGLPTS